MSKNTILKGIKNANDLLKKELTQIILSCFHGRNKMIWNDIKRAIKTPINDRIFQTYLNTMCLFDILRRERRGEYIITDSYKIEPLKLWHKEVIMNCPVENILPKNNITFFLYGLSLNDLSDEDIEKLRENKIKLDRYLLKIEYDVLKEAGYRKANEIWKKFINDVRCPPIGKFILWLLLIRNELEHSTKSRYFHTIREHRLEKIKQEFFDNYPNNIKGEEKAILNYIKNYWKKISAVDKKLKADFMNGAIWKWNDKFIALYTIAYHVYLRKKYPDIDNKIGKAFNQKLRIIQNKHYKLISQINDIILNSRLFLAVAKPLFLISEDIQEGYKIETNQANEIINAEQYVYEKHPLTIREKIIDLGEDYRNSEKAGNHLFKKMIKWELNRNREELDKFQRERQRIKKSSSKYPSTLENVEKKIEELKSRKARLNEIAKEKGIELTPKKTKEKNNFFRENNFLDGFENKIKELECTKEELYEELDKYANIFDIPILPQKV